MTKRGLFLLLLFSFLSFPFYRHIIFNGDFAEFVNNAYRFIHGDLPYINFWQIFPPDEVMLPALTLKIFGQNISTIYSLLVIIRIVSSLLFYKLSKEILHHKWLSFLLTLIYFYLGNNQLQQPWVLLGMIFLLRFDIHRKISDVIFSGLFFGAAFWFRFFEVAAPIFICYLYLLSHKKFSFKSQIIFLGSIALVQIPLLLFFPQLIYPEINQIFNSLIWSSNPLSFPYFSFVNSNLFQLSEISTNIFHGHIIQIFHLLYHFIYFLSVLIYYLIPLILGITLFVETRKTKNIKTLKTAWFLYLLGVVLFPKAICRPDLEHLSFSIGPWMILIGYLYLNFKQRFNYLFKTLLIVLTFISLNLFYIDTKLQKNTNYKVNLDKGYFFTSNLEESKSIPKLVSFIQTNSNRNDHLFVISWYAPPLYMLLDRQNSTYYDSLIDPIVFPDPDKQIDICQQILNGHTKFIIDQPGWSFDNNEKLSLNVADPLLKDCISNNFTKITMFGNYVVYKNNLSK